jgi:MATE family multidrug resistance protein
MLGVPLSIGQLYGEELLLALGQTEQTARLAESYLQGSPGSRAGVVVHRDCGFAGAVNRPEPGLWITIVAVPANLLLAYALIYGAFGLPRLELFGAGLATAIINTSAWWRRDLGRYACRPFKKYRILGRFWRADWPLFARLFIIRAPISVSLLMEYGLFAAAALLMGRSAPRRWPRIRSRCRSPRSCSWCRSIRWRRRWVGHAVGRRDPKETRRAGFAASRSAQASWRL